MEQFDPSRGSFDPYGFTCVRWSTHGMYRIDRHNEIEINFLLRGSLDYLHGGKKICVSSGRMAVFWAALPHKVVNINGVGDFYYAVTIPLVEFLEWGLPAALTQPLLGGEFLCETAPSAAQPEEFRSSQTDISRFENWCADFDTHDAARLRAARLEIHARLERFALSFSCPASNKSKSESLHKVELSKAEQMAGFIAVEYTQPITVADVSRVVGLHPNYAMSVFSKTFGLSIVAYIRQHRMAQAQSMLVSTNEAILKIAFAAGFQSVSQFYAVFKHYCHCSPSDYRAQYRD